MGRYYAERREPLRRVIIEIAVQAHWDIWARMAGFPPRGKGDVSASVSPTVATRDANFGENHSRNALISSICECIYSIDGLFIFLI